MAVEGKVRSRLQLHTRQHKHYLNLSLHSLYKQSGSSLVHSKELCLLYRSNEASTAHEVHSDRLRDTLCWQCLISYRQHPVP
jgi:hypothetical protein